MSEESLQSPSPLATMESSPSPSIHPSQWRSETDISYDLSQLLPAPLTQLREFQEGRDTSFESSPLCPSISPTSMGSLTAMTDTITTSIALTPLLSPLAPLPPPPAPVTQSVSSLSSGRDSEFVGSVLSGIFSFYICKVSFFDNFSQGSIELHRDIAEPFSAWISYGLHQNYSHHDKYH